MIKKIIGLFIIFTSLATFAAKPMYFDHMAVFGDSLSDNGNLYSYSFHMMPKSPPYFKGRFSNGPVWSEIFAKSNLINDLKFVDYAVGGAGAIVSDKGVLPYTLGTELSNYFSHENKKDNKSTLYVVWIGANNYLAGPENVEQITNDVVNGIETGIERIVKNGATMVVIGNLPDLGVIPESKFNNNQELTHRLTLVHNEKLLHLKERLVLQHPNVRFIYFNAFEIFKKAMYTPEKYGLTDVVNPCYEGGYYFASNLRGLMAVNPAKDTSISNEKLSNYLMSESKKTAKPLSKIDVKSYLTNPVLRNAIQNGYFASKKPTSLRFLSSGSDKCEGYLFWDKIHPTTHIHKFINDFFQKTMDEAAIVAKS